MSHPEAHPCKSSGKKVFCQAMNVYTIFLVCLDVSLFGVFQSALPMLMCTSRYAAAFNCFAVYCHEHYECNVSMQSVVCCVNILQHFV